MRICRLCQGEIELERLEILPTTLACSLCARKNKLGTPRLGRMIFDGKTGGTLQIMSAQSFKETKAYYEPVGPRSVIKNFSRNVCS